MRWILILKADLVCASMPIGVSIIHIGHLWKRSALNCIECALEVYFKS